MYKNLDNKVLKLLETTLIKEINKAGEALLTERIIPVTPIDQGDLRKSLTTQHATSKDFNFYWISRGNIAPHNLRVHELLGIVNWSEPGTGAKFLENPVKIYSKDYFTKAIKRGLKSNGF